jgi:aspartyl-tRNA(Asn)/glutamyl-tRNA(Gln) amidotransferase subunit A
MDPWIVRRFEAGREISDEQLASAHLQRRADQAAFHAWLEPWDALLSPTCPIPAPPIEGVDETTSPMSRLTRAANYLDLPAISVPCGLTDEGLPVGFQVMGRPRDESTVVALGAAIEAVSGWEGKRPDLSGFAA